MPISEWKSELATARHCIAMTSQGVKMFTKPHGLQNIIAEEWSAIYIFPLF